MKSPIVFLLCFMCCIVSCQQQLILQTPPSSVKNLLGNKVSTDSLDAFLETAMQQLKVQGLSFVLINEGKIVHKVVKGYANVENNTKATDKTIFEGASLSKPLFAYLVLMAVEEGKIDLDQPLYQYLPHDDLAEDERYQKISARMVLSHTTGLPNWRPEGGELKLQFEPGTSFGYSGEGYQYLAKVLAHIYETNDIGLETIYQKKIAKPFKMNVTKYIQDEYNLTNKAKPYDNGERIEGEAVTQEFGAAYSLHSEAEDFAKWMIAVMEERGLSKSSYDEFFKPQITLPEDALQRQQGVTDWTLGWAKATLPFGTVYAHGGNNPGYTSLIALDRDQKWGFVMFTNANQSEMALQTIFYLNSQ
ncbi:MAG: serine hydrolase domain-containing protein [Bacteroidota bacterium]